MDYELEVFEVYGDNEQTSSKKHLKHTRKKCKQKAHNSSSEGGDNDIHRSKISVISSEFNHRPINFRQSILSVFTKLFVCEDQNKYQTTVPEKSDSPHSSRSFHKTVPSYGEFLFVKCTLFFFLNFINSSYYLYF